MASSNIAMSVGYLAIGLGVIVTYLSVLLMIRYKKKPEKATAYITFANLSWAIACFTASVIYLFGGNNLVIGTVFQVIMYGSIFTATIFTYMFARKNFFKEKTKFYIVYILLGIVAIVILGVFKTSDEIRFPDSVDGNYWAIILKTEYSLILVAYLIPTIIGITVTVFKSAARVADNLYARGLQVIGYGQIFILGSFIADTIATLAITDITGYAISLFVQWICALIASICLYVGWTMPGWFKAMYSAKTESVASTK